MSAVVDDDSARGTEARVRDRFLELCEAVPIPRPWHLDTYIASVAEYRGRPITVVGRSLTVPTGGCGTGSGVWIARGDDDIIIHDEDASPSHAQHIVLHEIGHMLLEHDRDRTGHHGADVPDHGSALMATLLPSISAEAIRHVLCRSAYEDRIEREAEAFADAAALAATRAVRARASMRRTFFGGGRR